MTKYEVAFKVRKDGGEVMQETRTVEASEGFEASGAVSAKLKREGFEIVSPVFVREAKPQSMKSFAAGLNALHKLGRG